MEHRESEGYRSQLQSELRRRQDLNSRYSLRSFARTLNLSPAFLSKVLRGEKNLSPESALGIASRLRYSPGETAQFCKLVQANRTSEKVAAAIAEDAEEPGEALALQLEAFQVISDWYHYAIRELIGTRGFKPETAWIARRLGIGADDARKALARLTRLGLIERTRGGGYRNTRHFIATPTDQPSQALRNFHSQMIEKGRRALESQTVERRDITGLTLAISMDKMEIAKKEIRKFRRRLNQLLESNSPTNVYQLNIQFFDLTQEDL